MNYAYPNQYQIPLQAQTQPQMPQMQMQMQPQAQTQAQPQIQNGGFVCVPTIEDAKNYPVAPGNVVTFKIEGMRVLAEKSLGWSQFATPEFRLYKLVEEDVPEESTAPLPEYALKSDLDEINDYLADLQEQVDALKNPPKPKVPRKRIKEEDENES